MENLKQTMARKNYFAPNLSISAFVDDVLLTSGAEAQSDVFDDNWTPTAGV